MTQGRLDFDPPTQPAGFDGATYDKAQDAARLGKQLERVLRLMSDGHWRTLREIEDLLGYPQASVSARLRDLRKQKFGAWDVARRRRPPLPNGVPSGTWEYQVQP